MPAAIAWGNQFDGANLTAVVFGDVSAGSFDASYPAVNVIDPDPSRVARVNYTRNATVGSFVGISLQWATTAGGQLPARVASAINVRLPADATQVSTRINDYLGNVQAAQTYSAAQLAPLAGTTDRLNLPVLGGAQYSSAGIFLLVYVPPSTSGYIEIGCAWASPALVTEAVGDGFSYAPVDPSQVDRSDGGALLVDPRAVRDVFKAPVSQLTVEEAFGSAASPTAPSIRGLQFVAGKQGTVILLPRTATAFELQSMGVYGALRNVPSLRHMGSDRYDCDLEIEQIT